MPVINSSGHKPEVRAVKDMLLSKVEQKISSLFPESFYIITITELFSFLRQKIHKDHSLAEKNTTLHEITNHILCATLS